MAICTFMDAGTAQTQGLEWYPVRSGTVTSDGTTFRNNGRSLQLTSTSKAQTGPTLLVDAGFRVSAYVKLASAPASSHEFLQAMKVDTVTPVFDIGVDPTGVVFYASGFGGKNSAAGALTADGLWHRVSLGGVITSATNWTVKIWVDGSLVLTVSNTDFNSDTGATALQFSGPQTTLNVSDVYIDKSAADPLTDPGNIQVTPKRPIANGTANDFTTQIGAGGSGYGSGHSPQVNERPLSTTNGWSVANSGGFTFTEEYNIEGLAVGDVDLTGATIIDILGWIYAGSLTDETGQIVINGSQTNVALTEPAALFYVHQPGSTPYPAGTGADIGLITATTVSAAIQLYECGILVAYLPAAPQTTWLPQGMTAGRAPSSIVASGMSI